MALNFNIPMPQSGMDAFAKGFGLTDNLMKQILDRKNSEITRKHYEDQLKLQQAAAGRSAQAAADAHQMHLRKMDPNFEWEQFQKMFGGAMGGQGGQETQQPAMPQPTQEMGEGMGMYSPEGMQEAQQQAASVGAKPGKNLLDVLKNDPVKRAYFKYKYKFDPLAVDKESALHGPARDAADLAKLKKDVGEDSEVYQNAKASYDASLDAKKDLRDLRARTKAGLKPGEKEFFDPQSGEPLGKEIPLTAKERESEEGNILFQELYPLVYKGGSPFSGEGSISRLKKAAENYKTDPKARQMFDDLLLADKAIAATTVNEASTLKAGKTNTTYKMLKESLESQDIPKLIKKLIKEYNIPASAQLRAGMRYQKALSDARKKARKGTPATQKLFYNPEMQAQNEQQQAEGTPVTKGTKVINGITYYPDGQGGWEHD